MKKVAIILLFFITTFSVQELKAQWYLGGTFDVGVEGITYYNYTVINLYFAPDFGYRLVKIGIERGRKTRANLKCGVCGEHGGDPTAAEFFFTAGMNYVSCSPFRVPVARLAAAQAAIKAGASK